MASTTIHLAVGGEVSLFNAALLLPSIGENIWGGEIIKESDEIVHSARIDTTSIAASLWDAFINTSGLTNAWRVNSITAEAISTGRRKGIQGPSEFTLGGVLEGFSTTEHLSSVVVPVALTSGGYDTMRPPVVDALYRALPNSEWSMSRVSGHVTMIDDAGWTNDIIHDFLSRVEDSGVFVPDPTRCGPKDCLPKHSMTRNHHISNEVILFLSLVLGIAIGRLLPFSAHRREGYEAVV